MSKKAKKSQKKLSKSEKHQKISEKQHRKQLKKSQKFLNKLDNSDRVIELTSLERICMTEQIQLHHIHGDDRDGAALYMEYRELVDDRFANEDYVESFWIHSYWLEELYADQVNRNFGKK